MGVEGEGKTHVFEPYTLGVYKGGLYLIGKSYTYERVVYLNVERIETIEIDRDENGEPATFAYPRDYSPEEFTQGPFGIVTSDETTEVEILVNDRNTLARLQERHLHPTEKYRRRKDGKYVLTMKLQGTAELESWVLSWGPKVTVLKPEAIRESVRKQLEEALDGYTLRGTQLACREQD